MYQLPKCPYSCFISYSFILLFEGAFSLWVSLKRQENYSKLNVLLKLFTNEEDIAVILRLKGRFANSSICYEERHPILLRSSSVSYFTTLIVLDSCQKVLPHGIESTLNHIHTKCWITKRRKTVKRHFKKVCNIKPY